MTDENKMTDNPACRTEYFEKNHPTDIMHTVYNDISYNTLSDITAFNVGLTDTVPEIYMNPLWWS